MSEFLDPAEAAYYAAIVAHGTWHAAAESAMKYLASSGDVFSADDLRDLLADAGEPPTPNAWGGLFRVWKNAGLIKRPEHSHGGASRQKKRNGGHRYEWVGVKNAVTD